MKRWILSALVFAAIFPLLVGFLNKKTDLYENMMNASVMISDNIGGGSGVFIDDDVILTAGHVLENMNTCNIELSDGTILKSNDFYIDNKEDVGFIFVDTDELHIAKISSMPKNIGDIVFLVGTPYNKFFSFTLTKGIVSHLDRDIPEMGWKDLLQVDAEGGYGSSGGPLYDSEGRVIGIYVGHAGDGGIGITLCESAKSILEAYKRCLDAR
jgi:S1-C subfamily serine protease